MPVPPHFLNASYDTTASLFTEKATSKMDGNILHMLTKATKLHQCMDGEARGLGRYGTP